MQFELNEALLDDILFSMEDQDWDFYVDTQAGTVVNGDQYQKEIKKDHESRFISLPDWDSSSGFRLMERFIAAFRNPLIRSELSNALNQGKGVFRAFKNALSQHPEAEKHWYSFKEREMKREVMRWYNGLREEWGLGKIGLEPEETEDLVLEDFRFREFRADDRAAAAELHSVCLEESLENDRLNNEEAKKEEAEETLSLAAESGNGDFAGYVCANRNGKSLFIHTLEVKPEYRGLGIGKALLSHFLEKLDPSRISQIYLELPIEREWFSRALIREGFAPRITRYCLKFQK